MAKVKNKINDETQDLELDLSGEVVVDEIKDIIDEVVDDVKEEIVNEEVEETKEPVTEEVILVEEVNNVDGYLKNYAGVVINTSKLNVRKHASLEADIVDVIKRNDVVEINPLKSTENFYFIEKVAGEPIQGYCHKDYIVG